MTVSRVINGEANVRAETRERVEAAIKALDYTPSRAARTLAGRRGDPHRRCSTRTRRLRYLSELLVGSLDQASRSNVQLIVEKCDDEAEEQSAVDHLIARGSTASSCPRRCASRCRCSRRSQAQHPGGRGRRPAARPTGRSSVSIDDMPGRLRDDPPSSLTLGHAASASSSATRTRPRATSGCRATATR